MGIILDIKTVKNIFRSFDFLFAYYRLAMLQTLQPHGLLLAISQSCIFAFHPTLQSILERQLYLPRVAIHNELPSPLASAVITCLVLSRDLSIFSYWVGTLSGLSTRDLTPT